MATFSKRFGVGDPQGARSSEWVVMWKSDKSDVYLAGRTLGGSLKASIHESGQCHVRAPDPGKWRSPGSPPRFVDRWMINPHSQYEFPFGIIIPASELRSAEWATHKDKGTIWIPAPADANCAIEIAIFLTRTEPRPMNQLEAAGWETVIVLERLPDGRDLWVVAGEIPGLSVERRAELEQIKIQSQSLTATLQCPPSNPRLLLITGANENGARHFVEAAVYTPLINYKYRSGPAALRCLLDGTAYFASPSELNDSLEAKFDMAEASHHLDTTRSTLNELALQRGEPGGYSFNKAAFEEFERMNSREDARFHESCQRVGIFSTAIRPDNQPMWAYYCDNSQGMCFELEWSDAVLRKHLLIATKVTYATRSRIQNRSEDFCELLREAGRRHPKWSVAQLQEHSLSEDFRRRAGMMSTARAVSIKHADWRHEDEVRLIVARAGPLPIMADILKRVFFIHTDFPEYQPIVTLLRQRYPKVKLIRLSFEHREPFVRMQPLETKQAPVAEEDESIMPST